MLGNCKHSTGIEDQQNHTEQGNGEWLGVTGNMAWSWRHRKANSLALWTGLRRAAYPRLGGNVLVEPPERRHLSQQVGISNTRASTDNAENNRTDAEKPQEQRRS
jgi:hypothetical protein